MGGIRHYLTNIQEGIRSSVNGLGLTLRHLWSARGKTPQVSIHSDSYFSRHEGIVTLEYPYEAIPVPDNGRYRLHNEIDDCIVCDKCAKICPVDCIEIEAIKSTEEIGLTSDGTSKRLYASKFDIDMAKCCYCGLCTTVCPTECLTMTPTFDYSEFDVRDMNYHFTDLSPEEAQEKQRLYDQKQAEKAAAKLAQTVAAPIKPEENNRETPVSDPQTPKPSFKPKFASPKVPSVSETNTESNASFSESKTNPDTEDKPKPAFKPKMPAPKTSADIPATTPNEPATAQDITSDAIAENRPKPIFRPKIPANKTELESTNSNKENEERSPLSSTGVVKSLEQKAEEPKTSIKPVFKPKIPAKKTEISASPGEATQSSENLDQTSNYNESLPEEAKPAPPKPVFKPKMKPIVPPKQSDDTANEEK